MQFPIGETVRPSPSGPLVCAALSALLFLLSAAVTWAQPSPADDLMPYDEQADAAVEIAAAIETAAAAGKLLLIDFGANWCPDCRAFAAATRSPQPQAVLAEHFVAVKVDVGNWDKHPQVVAAWGDPIEGGIPAIVVATPGREVLFSTKAGQLSKARHMAPAEFAEFFTYLASLAP